MWWFVGGAIFAKVWIELGLWLPWWVVGIMILFGVPGMINDLVQRNVRRKARNRERAVQRPPTNPNYYGY